MVKKFSNKFARRPPIYDMVPKIKRVGLALTKFGRKFSIKKHK